jgi:hypothetical protein
VLAAKGHQAADGRAVAALDVGAQELAALAEADGVDGRRRAQDLVLGQVEANLVDLLRDVAEEGGRAVLAGVVVDARVVDEGAGVDGLG